VGGASERAGAKAGGSNPSAIQYSFACRDGERHPGLLEGGALRGATSERGPRSVRHLQRYPPLQKGAPMTADVRRSPRRGTSSACATKRMHPFASTRDRRMRSGTRPSLGPSTRACQSSLCTQRSNSLSGGAFESASRLGKPTQVGGTSTGAERTDGARLAACHRFRKGESVPRQKRKEVEASVPASTRELGFGCPHVDCFVAEVGRRRLASNKLGKRAPKRAVRVE